MTGVRRAAAAALGCFFALASAAPAQVVRADAGVAGNASVGGVASGIGGAVRGTIGGVAPGVGSLTSAGGTAHASPLRLSGPDATVGGLGSAPSAFGAPASLSTAPSFFRGNGSATASLQAEVKQQLIGTLRAVANGTVTMQLTDGSTRSFQAAPALAATLRGYVGKDVYLRSADGTHITSLVGRQDTTRGIVTAVNGQLVTFVSPNGEVHSIMLDRGGVEALTVRVGSSVVGSSNDFGRTANVTVLSASPHSALLDVYVGRLGTVAAGTAVLGMGRGEQSFAVSPATARLLRGLRGRTVAVAAPDGVHVKNVLADATVAHLVAAARARQHAGNAIEADVVASSAGRLTLQLPNGDTASYLGNVARLGIRARAPVTVTPLDRFHVRVTARGHAATLLGADVCATVNARCRDAMNGSVVASTPTSVSVELPGGDVATYLGDMRPLSAAVNAPITVTPLDATHARLTAGTNVLNAIDATACVTINDGCRAMPGTVTSTGKGSLGVTLADGHVLALSGRADGIAMNAPVLVQALDGTHAMVQTGAQAADLANAAACASLNAVCADAGGVRLGVSVGRIPGSANDGGAVNAGGGNSGAPGTGRGPGLREQSGDGTGVRDTTAAGNARQVATANAAASTCSQDGQIAATVSDVADGHPLANVVVTISGPVEATWHTDAAGAVRFVKLPSGSYRMHVASAAYKTIASPAFHVDCQAAATLHFRLAPLASSSSGANSSVVVGMGPRANRQTVALTASRGAVCVATPPHRRRSVLCSG